MDVVFDIEANGLNPDKLWVIVCKDIDGGGWHVFREPRKDNDEGRRFLAFSSRVRRWVGHNCLGYDLPVLGRLLGLEFCYDFDRVVDTLILSKTIDYPRQGHSLEHYGEEFGVEKDRFSDFTKYSIELENRCIKDVDLTEKVYHKYLRYISNPDHVSSLDCEHRFQEVVNNLSDNGFSFNTKKANELLLRVEGELKVLDKDILDTFVPKLKLIRVVTPKETKYGTISLASIPRDMRDDVSVLSVGSCFCHCAWTAFNPGSHKQIIEVLNQAGWRPVDKTSSHIETERSLRLAKGLDKENLSAKLEGLLVTGWKVNENNLETLPPTAPSSARLLAKRILLESRRRTLAEWLGLVDATTQRIHGRFYGIGAWTHRMAHQSPNTANIPNEFDTQGKKKLLGKELRSLWCAPRNRLLVGCDAEGIQLRIFAHYINDPQFTEALVNGKKEDKTDPHSLNQSILGDCCKSRAAAKRYIYALLLGAGKGKLQEILDCSEQVAEEAYQRLLRRYQGFQYLKDTIIPRDAKRGWFIGLDGRRVRIPGDETGSRRHLAMSGYLQNGEAVVMKRATLRFLPLLPKDCFLVNLVHDEWQTESPNSMEIALRVASLQADSLRIVGEELNLNCPLAGSYYNDDTKDYTIDKNWSKTH